MYPDELGSSEYVMEVIKREAGDCFSEFRLRLIEEKEIEIK